MIESFQNNEIILSKNDLLEIIDEDWDNYSKIFDNCFCSNCPEPHITTIIEYQIILNDLNDIILRGKCFKCGHKVNRYTETGEVPKYVKRIKKFLNNI